MTELLNLYPTTRNRVSLHRANNTLGFYVSQDAKDLLRSLGNERVGVIAVAGKYRTGKSFLLNRILLE